MKKHKISLFFYILVLSLNCLLCLLCHIPSLLKFGPIIAEADSCFNWMCAQYIEKNGISSFFNWFDNNSWYPQGRYIGKTTYPGLMIMCYFFKNFFKFFHINIELKTICIFIGPIFSLLIPIFFYLLCILLTKRRSCALLSSSISSISVVLTSCSFIGFFDNQSISITLILIDLYLFIRPIINSNFTHQNQYKSINIIQNNILMCLIYGFLSITSGEYAYLANIFALISFFSIFFGFFSINLYLTYSIWFVLGTIMSASLPYIGNKVLFSFAHLFPNLVFIIIQFYSIFCVIRKSLVLSQKVVNSIFFIFIILIILIIILLFFWFSYLDCNFIFDRIKYVIFPFLSNKEKSFLYSVEEQNPTSWSMFYVSFGPFLYTLPIGIYILLKKQLKNKKENEGLFILILTSLPTFYFSTTMIRNLPIFSIYFILISSYSIDNFLRRSFKSLFQIKNHKNTSKIDSFVCIFLIFCFCLLQIYHSIYFNLNPSYETTLYRPIEIKSNLNESKTIISDSNDLNEGLMWIRNNTPMNSKIISLWPHGYSISSHTKRTVFCDGNTNNITHMNLIHFLYSSNEKKAWKIAKFLNADYIIVIFGGASGYKFDDLYFSTTFLKSLEIEYKDVKIDDFFNSPFLSSENPTDSAKNSMIFKLSYYNFNKWILNDKMKNGFDISRGFKVGCIEFKLELFKEVFTSKNWLFRVYRVSDNFVWNFN